MLAKLRFQHYKSLFDTTVDLEPLTVFIGPNGSGKSNICEALAVLSNFLQRLLNDSSANQPIIPFFANSLQSVSKDEKSLESKFWHGKSDSLDFEIYLAKTSKNIFGLIVTLDYLKQNISIGILPIDRLNRSQGIRPQKQLDLIHSNIESLRGFLIKIGYANSPLADALRKVNVYDFAPIDLSQNVPSNSMGMERTGKGIADTLLDILLDNRQGFNELEERLVTLVPNIKRISLQRSSQTVSLELVDKYSEHHIPVSDISDGTLRILAFLTALYQKDTPSIICFEELENGVHPWLLHKMMELLKIVSTEGINGKPVQVLITTHSPVLLNYVEPYQVRAVELDSEGKTQVHKLPIDSVRFQKALEAYDGDLGELWFTNVFGGNPA
jgi:predicted ATPase